MKKIEIIPENINLFLIKINESAVNNDSLTNKNSNVNLNIAQKTQNNLKDERVKIDLIIDIQSTEPNNKFSANFDIDFHFKIKDLKDFYTLDKNEKPLFSGLFISTLIGISYSTARGIIFERLSKTNMKSIILPVVAPNKILFPSKDKKNTY